MVYNLIIWTAFAMALLIIASLYFSYLKLKIHYRGIKCFIVSQVLISLSLFLLWFLSDETKYFISPLIAILLLSGAYLYHESAARFGTLKQKSIDLYILLPLGFMVHAYFIYINEQLLMQVISLYLIAFYMFVKSSVLVYASRHHHEDVKILSISFITLGFAVLYLFRVINVFFIDNNLLNYHSLKDIQILTVILTFLLQILLTFNVSNIIYSRARTELNKINSGFHHSPVSMMMVNTKGLVLDINRRFSEFLNYDPKDMIGKHLEELQLFNNSYDSQSFINLLETNQVVHNKEISVTKSDGTLKQTLISISNIDYVDQHNSIITFTDISKIYLLTEKLTDYAYYDDLTNLTNRRYLNRYFDAKIIENKRFVLMCIDLDNFKDVNDTYGHIVGDEVLAVLSKRLMDAVSKKDFIARYAGDEFILILDLEDKTQTLDEKTKMIMDAIEQNIQINLFQLKLKASIGIAKYPLHGTKLNELVKQADHEMYKVKRLNKIQTKTSSINY